MAEDISEQVISEHPVHFIWQSLSPEYATNLSLYTVFVFSDVDKPVIIFITVGARLLAVEFLVRDDSKQVKEVLFHLDRSTVNVNETWFDCGEGFEVQVLQRVIPHYESAIVYLCVECDYSSSVLMFHYKWLNEVNAADYVR